MLIEFKQLHNKFQLKIWAKAHIFFVCGKNICMKIIDECDKDLSQYGFAQKKHQFGICENILSIKTDKQQNKTGWQKGDYYIVNCPDLYLYNQKIVDYVEDILKKILKKILAKTSSYKKVLVVGLGNREVVCDSFGVNVTSKILTTGHIDANLGAKVFCLCPMVECQSGISTSQIVCAIAKNIGADLVVLVDSFMTSSIKRLAHSFQFSSNGLIPGGAVGKTNSIDKSSLGIETISIGIPFMLNLKDICSNIKKDIIVSQKDIMQNIQKTSLIVANVINCVLFPSLNKQEICELIYT